MAQGVVAKSVTGVAPRLMKRSRLTGSAPVSKTYRFPVGVDRDAGGARVQGRDGRGDIVVGHALSAARPMLLIWPPPMFVPAIVTVPPLRFAYRIRRYPSSGR